MGHNTYTLYRFTMEARSPLMIASGDHDVELDVTLARDPNGLPMLPATSLAGCLRARVCETKAEASADCLFGWQKQDKGQRSRISLTDGLFHWQDNRPRDGLLSAHIDRMALQEDALCSCVLAPAPVQRDHVRLNACGVVDGEGKFTRSATPAGSRFTFEMRGLGVSEEELEAIADNVRAGVWLGSATRSGYGALVCIAEGRVTMDLSTPDGWAQYCDLAGGDIGCDSPITLEPVCPPNMPVPQRLWRLKAQFEGPVLIGGPPRTPGVDRAPYCEPIIKWDAEDKKGRVIRPEVGGGESDANTSDTINGVLPASSIKGALRHRTLYHLKKSQVADPERGLEALFGCAAGAEGGCAGRLRFFDCPLEGTCITQTHVGLDRFTGGSRQGVLFTDVMLWSPKVDIIVEELKPLSLPQHAAFKAAITDLANGLCGIGADWGDGAGVLDGEKQPDIPLARTDQPLADMGQEKGQTDAA